MIVFHSEDAALHDPVSFVRHGKAIPHPENASRYRLLLDAVKAAGHDLRLTTNWGEEPILRVHDADYVNFLRSAWDTATANGMEGDEIVTSQFARVPPLQRPASLPGLMGLYSSDTSTGIRSGTWQAAYGAAQTAISAARQVLASGQTVYALCRPPGHHAYRAHASGFCFLNNAAIAAEQLLAELDRVAILDIDVHHGDGTQHIFYSRGDVLNVSIHASTETYFPHFSGSAAERGEGAGEGMNLNFPLAHGSGDEAYVAAIAQGLETIKGFGPQALIVSLGLDAAEDDPIGVLNVTEEGFARAASLIASLGVPSLLVQEGGYPSAALQSNLRAFLSAYDEIAERAAD